MIAGRPNVSHSLSIIKWAALWAVKPTFLVGLAITYPLNLTTHNKRESNVFLCHSTLGNEKISSATLDMTCVGTWVGTMGVFTLQFGC